MRSFAREVGATRGGGDVSGSTVAVCLKALGEGAKILEGARAMKGRIEQLHEKIDALTSAYAATLQKASADAKAKVKGKGK